MVKPEDVTLEHVYQCDNKEKEPKCQACIAYHQEQIMIPLERSHRLDQVEARDRFVKHEEYSEHDTGGEGVEALLIEVVVVPSQVGIHEVFEPRTSHDRVLNPKCGDQHTVKQYHVCRLASSE